MTSPKRLAALGGGAPAVYVEDTFSTYLYSGTGASQTITNNIDISTNGGLVWIKGRSGGTGHRLTDTVRGATKSLESNNTVAEATESTGLTAFGTTGFTIGADADYNTNAGTYVSWTFRKQAKFFDVVTYTGDGVAGRQITHNLGSVPGCIIVKRLDTLTNWAVYHRSTGATQFISLNLTNAAATSGIWNNTTPTSTNFTVRNDSVVNASGGTYVAYLFAHDAGGFGLSGTDNVISCGIVSSGTPVNLGWEPQFILGKYSTSVTQWQMSDSMRGMTADGSTQRLFPNLSNAEDSSGTFNINATGFSINSGADMVYIAIRRGPMKTPTSGTSVFAPLTQTGAGTSAGQTLTTNFPVDLEISSGRAVNSGPYFIDRLRGGQNYIISTSTAAEVNFTGYTPLISFANNTGILDANYGSTSNSYISWNFRRAPGFFDEVCYTGTGSTRTVAHNLGVAPELVIYKARDFGTSWNVYAQPITASNRLALNATDAQTAEGGSFWNGVAPTATNLTVVSNNGINGSGLKYVAYLFATVAGVSKVGSYTGNGSSQTINCGFAAGARFIMIKRTDSTGDWYVWDTARGIVTANDPHLSLNTTAAEVTTDDSIDPDNSGFIVNQLAATNINVSSASYIFLAIS